MNDILFHYTTGTVFKKILKQGAILPDKNEPDNEKEIPTVTFSSHPIWEKTRFRVGRLPDGQLVMLSQKLLQKYDGGLIRISVPASVAPMDWHTLRDTCGMSRAAIQGIYDFAISVGARTSEWFGTTEPVSEDVWINVEKMDDNGVWIDLPENEIPALEDEVEDSAVVDVPEGTNVESALIVPSTL